MSDCEHKRTIMVSTHHSDSFCIESDGKHLYEGYGNIPGISTGKYMEMKLCVGCGTVMDVDPKVFGQILDGLLMVRRAESKLTNLWDCYDDIMHVLSAEDSDFFDSLYSRIEEARDDVVGSPLPSDTMERLEKIQGIFMEYLEENE